jgi:hypothetical protein
VTIPLWKGRPVTEGHPLRAWERRYEICKLNRRGHLVRGWTLPPCSWTPCRRSLDEPLHEFVVIPWRFMISRAVGKGHGKPGDVLVRGPDGYQAFDLDRFKAEWVEVIE